MGRQTSLFIVSGEIETSSGASLQNPCDRVHMIEGAIETWDADCRGSRDDRALYPCRSGRGCGGAAASVSGICRDHHRHYSVGESESATGSDGDCWTPMGGRVPGACSWECHDNTRASDRAPSSSWSNRREWSCC
eukprot:Opistho-2@12269